MGTNNSQPETRTLLSRTHLHLPLPRHRLPSALAQPRCLSRLLTATATRTPAALHPLRAETAQVARRHGISGLGEAFLAAEAVLGVLPLPLGVGRAMIAGGALLRKLGG